MIDSDGFRPNVGIVLVNTRGQVLWARRIGQNAWQFPQGGIKPDEAPEEALYRELQEEVGLVEADVKVLARTQGWLRYRTEENLSSDLQNFWNDYNRILRQHEHAECS